MRSREQTRQRLLNVDVETWRKLPRKKLMALPLSSREMTTLEKAGAAALRSKRLRKWMLSKNHSSKLVRLPKNKESPRITRLWEALMLLRRTQNLLIHSQGSPEMKILDLWAEVALGARKQHPPKNRKTNLLKRRREDPQCSQEEDTHLQRRLLQLKIAHLVLGWEAISLLRKQSQSLRQSPHNSPVTVVLVVSLGVVLTASSEVI